MQSSRSSIKFLLEQKVRELQYCICTFGECYKYVLSPNTWKDLTNELQNQILDVFIKDF